MDTEKWSAFGLPSIIAAGVLAVWRIILSWIRSRRRQHKEIMEKLSEIGRHNHDNYMNILRLTVTNTSMPMSERLKAGKKYTDEGGNGEVAALYKKLEREFMKEDAK